MLKSNLKFDFFDASVNNSFSKICWPHHWNDSGRFKLCHLWETIKLIDALRTKWIFNDRSEEPAQTIKQYVENMYILKISPWFQLWNKQSFAINNKFLKMVTNPYEDDTLNKKFHHNLMICPFHFQSEILPEQVKEKS